MVLPPGEHDLSKSSLNHLLPCSTKKRWMAVAIKCTALGPGFPGSVSHVKGVKRGEFEMALPQAHYLKNTSSSSIPPPQLCCPQEETYLRQVYILPYVKPLLQSQEYKWCWWQWMRQIQQVRERKRIQGKTCRTWEARERSTSRKTNIWPGWPGEWWYHSQNREVRKKTSAW